MEVPLARFEDMLADAYERLPDWVREAAHNVAIVVEEAPEESGLLGLYEGIPLTDGPDDVPSLPARITLYRSTICAACHSMDEVEDEIEITLIHEVAHHLGIDDDRLDELGWA